MGGKNLHDRHSFAWTWRTVTTNGIAARHHTLTCSTIGCKESITNRANSNKFNPYSLDKWFRRQGWELDMNTDKATVCPKCQEARRHKTPASKDQIAHMAREADRRLEETHTKITAALNKALMEEEAHLRAKETQPVQAPTTVQLTPPPPLTVDQRANVRAALDDCFNVTTGSYAAGWSDQIIAAKMGVPWQSVARLREAAYGPIKTDAELEQLKADGKLIDKSVGQMIDAIAKLDSTMRDWMKRVEAVEAKYKP